MILTVEKYAEKDSGNRVKRTLAIIACKASAALLRLIGRGSSLPGKIALLIHPGILGELELPPVVIAVSGSNGKTSTVEMISSVLSGAGMDCASNREGSNQIEGITAFLTGNSDPGGKVLRQAVVLEVDERYARIVFRWFSPTCYVITNLFRDQLTRNGHPENVAEALRESLREESLLIVNADDPMAYSLASGFGGRTVTFGLKGSGALAGMDSSVYDDSSFCPVCGERMDTSDRDGDISYSCASCGFCRPSPDHTAQRSGDGSGRIVIDGETELKTAQAGTHLVYNILAAYCACLHSGIGRDIITEELSGYVLKNGRVTSFTLGGHAGTFLASKHENSVSYDQNLLCAAAHPGDITVYILVDSISRKYFTGDTSWLWDVDFGILASPNVRSITVGGRYAADVLLRLRYCGIDGDIISATEDIGESVRLLRENARGHIYALTCFSDEKKLFRALEDENENTAPVS